MRLSQLRECIILKKKVDIVQARILYLQDYFIYTTHQDYQVKFYFMLLLLFKHTKASMIPKKKFLTQISFMSKLCNYISMQYQLSKEKQNKKEG